MNPIASRGSRYLCVAILTLGALALGGCQNASPAGGTASPTSAAVPTSAAAGPTAAPTAKPLTQVTVALDWYPWSNHTGLYLAQEKGYYREEGLDVKIYVPSNPEDVLKLVGAGKDTFGISYQSDVLLAGAEEIPVTSIAALVQHPLDSIMTLKSSGITRPKQLEGKKVGYPGIPGEEAQLVTMLQSDGSSIDKVELVNVGYDLVQALISKKVDAVIGAYWVHESILAEMEGYPVNVMKVEDWGVPDFYELVMVANQKMVKEQPDTIRRFLQATSKGYADAMKDPDQAVELLAKVNPETNKQMEQQGIRLLMPLWTEGVPSFGWQTKERWDALAGWMRQHNLLEKDVNVDSLFTSEFLPK